MITEDDFNKFLTFFNNFVTSSDLSSSKQEKFILKITHTKRVVELGEKLAKELNLNLNLAKTICLFHDLGRFPQIEKYDSLSDLETEDHAELGLKVLAQSNILDSFEEKDLVIAAIRYHNKILYDIPELDEETKKYLNFIRDVDKVDIYRIVFEKHLYENLGSANPKCVYDFLANKQVDRKDIRSDVDKLILQLSWIHDINYSETYKILKHDSYVEKLANLLPDNLNNIKKI